eukprot:4132358-Pleurochrysis_carterae.AAC.1
MRRVSHPDGDDDDSGAGKRRKQDGHDDAGDGMGHDDCHGCGELLWAMLEGATRDAVSVLVCAPKRLVEWDA